MPLVIGMEAAGVVEALGEGVERFRLGDHVAYASRPLGSYRDLRNFPAERCVALPAGISDRDAAAGLLKGLTVQMLVRRVFRVAPGAWAVFHSAAGGVGRLAGQWLRAIGAARAAGYEAVFVRGRDDWPARVRELSGGGVPVVYDPVGRETWEGSLSCLAPRGHLVCFGNSSGLVPPFSVNVLRDRGSLSLSWVPFGDYTADPTDSRLRRGSCSTRSPAGALRPAAPRCLSLAQAAEAHRLLESGRTTGTLVLVP